MITSILEHRIWWSGFLWLAAFAFWRPTPGQSAWAEALLLLAPLFLVPLGLELIRPKLAEGWAETLRGWGRANYLPGAVLLLPAFFFEPGILPAALTLWWFAATAAVSVSALLRIWNSGIDSASQLAEDAALLFLGVGAAWTLANRLGLRPLDFEPTIVLLTAVHFHYAGFALALLTGLASRRLNGLISRMGVAGVVAGVPLVAAGITATQLGAGIGLEAFAACWLALAGLIAAWLQLRLALLRGPAALRVLRLVSALALGASMLLAALYGCRAWVSIPRLDIPAMWLLHGTANAFGFALCGLLAHRFEPRDSIEAGDAGTMGGRKPWP